MRDKIVGRLMETFEFMLEEERDSLEFGLDCDLGFVSMDTDTLSLPFLQQMLSECNDEELLTLYDYFLV